MLAAVDLHQLAQTLAPQPRLVQLPALLAGVPKAGKPWRSRSISAASVGPKSA